MTQAHNTTLDQLFGVVTGEDDLDRACKAIPDEACTNVPRNYFLNVSNGAATKLAEQIAGPNLVLPWLISLLGSPVFLVGMLMPIKQVGSLLPQMVVSGQIRRFSRRKGFWVAAGLIQACCLLLMILAAIGLPPLAAGLSIVGLLAVFSVASGVGSVAFQDVLGKTIPKGVRGKLLSNRAFIGGVLTTLAGLILKFWIGEEGDLLVYMGLLGIAAGLWAVGAALFAAIQELPGATAGGRNAIQEGGAGFRYLRTQSGYRQYLLVRALLLSVELAIPFYVLHAQAVLEGGAGSLGLFVIAVGIANTFSSPFWGRFADLASHQVMLVSGLLGALTAALALAMEWLPPMLQNAYVYGLVFILIGLAEAGVRLGRKTYLVDAVPEAERPTYVAFANTAIGLVTLLAMSFGLIVQLLGIQVMLLVLGGLGLLAALASFWLPPADDMIN